MATFEDLLKAEEPEYSVREKTEAFYQGTDAIGEFAQKVMIPVLRDQLKKTDKETAITGTYFRMYAWVQSLIRLNDPRHFQAAATVARALFELLLDIKLLDADTNGKMVAKFHAFPEIERFQMAKDYVECADRNPDVSTQDAHQRKLVSQPEKEEDIRGKIVKHWGKTKGAKPNSCKPPIHWSGMNIRERAQQFGTSFEKRYLFDYRIGCLASHSGSAIYAGLDSDALESIFCLSHGLSQEYFLEATQICADVMNISTSVEEFPALVKELGINTRQGLGRDGD